MKWLAVVSALVLFFLVARYDGTAQGPHWSQSEAEHRIRATAQALGIDASKWRVIAAASFNDDLAAAVHNQQLAWPEAFSPLRYQVAAVSDQDSDLSVEYAPTGALLRWDCHHCAGKITPEAAMRLLAGDRVQEFNTQHKWMGRSPAGTSMVADISQEDGKVTSAALIVDARARRTPVFFRGLRTTSWILCLIGAGIVVFFRAFRRREARRLVRGIFVFWTVAFVFTLVVEGKRWRDGETLEAHQSLARDRAGWFWANLFARPFFWAMPCAAGLLLLRGRQIEPWVGLLHAGERWKPARRSGEEIFEGLLMGWPLALIPYAAAVVTGPVWEVISPRVAFENIPSLVGMLQRTNFAVSEVAYFGFLVPLLALVRNAKWRIGLLAITAVALFGWLGRFTPVHPWAAVAVSLAAGAVSWWIYRRQGLLGLFAAWAGSTMATPLAWLAGAPGNHLIPLTASLAVYGGSLAGASWLRKQGYPGEDEELVAEIVRRNTPTADWTPRSQREQLQLEFAEAREAQQGMLPESAPVIPGYSLAAVCVPAREVGGDLYDFLKFPDGQLGLCVADVSGKGVPAALYMTMTKGVLASAQRLTANLDELALALNEPLYEAGRRKTFVTLGLAKLDPDTGKVEVIRAGHNPFVWRRAAQDETILLQPGGLGLGMVSNKMFGRRLEHQTILMGPGDTLLLYSDGLTETENPALELFGEERLMEIARQGDHLDADALMKEILTAVEHFQQGADQHDDLTLLVLKATPLLPEASGNGPEGHRPDL